MSGTETILLGAIGGCVSAIVFLFGLEQARHKETKAEVIAVRSRLDECERVRFNTVERVARLESGCHHHDCPLRKKA